MAAAAVPGPLRAALPAAAGLLRKRHAPHRPRGCPCGTRRSCGAAVPDGRSGAQLPGRTDGRSAVRGPPCPTILEHLHCTAPNPIISAPTLAPAQSNTHMLGDAAADRASTCVMLTPMVQLPEEIVQNGDSRSPRGTPHNTSKMNSPRYLLCSAPCCYLDSQEYAARYSCLR